MTPARRAADPRPSRWWLLVVASAATLPYLNSLPAAFTFDDFGLVVENPMAAPGMSALAWFARLSTTGPLYRPITMVSYAANHWLSPGPFGYHLGNVGLHALATIAAFELAWILLRSVAGAVATAVVFAVHPAHTEAVTSIAGRADVLAGLFVLAALLTFARAQQETSRRKAVWRLASACAFAAGLLSKESALAAIPLLLLVSLWLAPAPRMGQLTRALLPHALIGAAWLALRRLLVGALTQIEPAPFLDNPLFYVGLGPRLRTAIVVLWQYVALLAAPLRLSADESFNQVPIAAAMDPRFLGAVGVFVLLALALLAARRHGPVLLLAAAFFGVSLAVTGNVIFPIGTIKAERLLYLPSFGWCLACGWLIDRWLQRRHRGSVTVVTVVVIALAARTWLRNEAWRDNYTLFTATVQDSPQSARAQSNAAAVHGQAGELDAAITHYRKALDIFPQFASAALGMGQAYELKGDDDEALHWYGEAARLDPGLTLAHLRSGSLHLRRGESARAEAAYRAGLAAAPNEPALLLGLASARLAQGDRGGAETLIARAEAVGAASPDVLRLVDQARHALGGR